MTGLSITRLPRGAWQDSLVGEIRPSRSTCSMFGKNLSGAEGSSGSRTGAFGPAGPFRRVNTQTLPGRHRSRLVGHSKAPSRKMSLSSGTGLGCARRGKHLFADARAHLCQSFPLRGSPKRKRMAKTKKNPCNDTPMALCSSFPIRRRSNTTALRRSI